MSFTSLTFWGFFALTFAAYWLLRDRRAQNILLLLASYIFYGWLAPGYALLLATSTLTDFFLARRMQANRDRTKVYLAFSLLLNLGVLGVFKYYNFFNTQVAETLTGAGLPVDW